MNILCASLTYFLSYKINLIPCIFRTPTVLFGNFDYFAFLYSTFPESSELLAPFRMVK